MDSKYSLRNKSGHFTGHGEPYQPPYGHKDSLYNYGLDLFEGRVLPSHEGKVLQ